MALNIKNPQTHALAAEFAQRLDMRLTEAVTLALRERLAQTPEAAAAKAARAAEMATIARRMARRLTPEGLVDPDDLRHDERGLPKR